METELPGVIDKRNMLWAPDPRRPFDAVATGDGFASKGRLAEALDFYERIADAAVRDERVGRIKKAALESGNAFLVNRVATRGFVPVSKPEWETTAQNAKKAGQLRHALRAAIQAGNDALAQELRATLGDAVPAALAAQAESPEQAKAGTTTPGQKVEAVAATGAAHAHEPKAFEPPPAPETDEAKKN